MQNNGAAGSCVGGLSGSIFGPTEGLVDILQVLQSGLLLMQGLDRGSLGFNLLMGRTWLASENELEEARLLCEELGLGPLPERMPSGMMQMVGETGWQLSHGERSRIFLARALRPASCGVRVRC
jgi:ABC-type transport system involved in cytochrome bd biosynthesis fused ATPase/permease subunit